MADFNVKGKIEIDISGKSVKEVHEDIKNLRSEMHGAKVGSSEYEQAAQKLAATQKALSNATKEKTGNFAQLKETLKGTVPAFEGASSGAAGLGKQLLALMANPIVLLIAGIVLALKGLYEAFTHTIPGAEKMGQIFEGLGQVLNVVMDRLIKFGNAIIKFFTFDFKGAGKDMKEAFSGAGDAMVAAYNKGAEARKKLQQIHKEEMDDLVQHEQTLAKIADLKERVNDESIPLAKRKQEAADLRKLIEENGEEDLKRTREKVTAEKSLLEEKAKNNQEAADKMKELDAEVFKSERDLSNEKRAANKIIANLERQQAQIDHEISEKRKKDLEEELKKREELAKFGRKLLKDSKEEEEKILSDGLKMVEEEKKADEKKAADWQKSVDDAAKAQAFIIKAEIDKEKEAAAQKLEIEKKLAEAKKSIWENTVTAMQNLSMVAGRETVFGKALAVASSIISTWRGVAKSLEAGPIGIPSAIAIGAAGFAAVKNILAVQVPGAGGGGSVPAAAQTIAAPIQPQQAGTSLNSQSIQAIGNAAAGGVNRSFVLDADIRNNSERASRITRAARLG